MDTEANQFPDFDEQQGQFAPLVGRAILNFGQVEYSILQAVEVLGRDIEEMARTPLTRRLDSLINTLKDREQEHSKRLTELLKKVKVLARTRNMIAHNPLVIDLCFTNGAHEWESKICTYLDREKKITFSELHLFCLEVEALADELVDAIHGVLIENFDLLNKKP